MVDIAFCLSDIYIYVVSVLFSCCLNIPVHNIFGAFSQLIFTYIFHCKFGSHPIPNTYCGHK